MNAVHSVLENAELTLLIFSFLKEGPAKWKAGTARLATVNRAFSHAAISVIWEEMDSFNPFCYLLVPSHDASLAHSRPISDSQLDRFNLYAGKTRTLILNDPPFLLENPCWAYYLGACKMHPGGFFPALINLLLNSADALSLFIAFSVSSHVRGLSICLDPALTTEVTERSILELAARHWAARIKTLRIIQLYQPFRPVFLEQMSRLIETTVQSLVVSVSSGDGDSLIPTMWAPADVHIEESLWQICPYPPLRYESIYRLWQLHLQAPPLPLKHRALIMRGAAELHDMVISHLPRLPASKSFSGFNLCVDPKPGLPTALNALTSETLAMLLRSNPSASKLTVHGDHFQGRQDFPPEALPRIRLDARFHAVDILLNQLTASRSLSILKIYHVHFPAGDVILKMLKAVEALPQLRIFWFVPLPLSDAPQDALVYPTLAFLEIFTHRCPNLFEVGLSLDLFHLGLPPRREGFSNSQIFGLCLHPSPGGLPAYTMAQNMLVAKYLYDVCPRLTTLSSSWHPGDPRKHFWDDIFVIIASFRTLCFMDATHRVLETAELISSIFGFLKGEGKWKGPVAGLATVNRAFFHAGTAVIWEEMDSFEPFCSLLLPGRQPHPVDAGLDDPDIPSDEGLDRFDLYASKTKTLILNEASSLLSDPGWACYLSVCKDRPTGIFPALNNLYLNSADALSLFVAFSVAPGLLLLSIYLDAASVTPNVERVLLQLAIQLARQNRSLKALQLINPARPAFLYRISSLLSSIVRLNFAICSGESTAITPNLWIPTVVEVDQINVAPWVEGLYTQIRDVVMERVRYQPPVLRTSIRKLVIRGGVEFQEMIANHPCKPTPSRQFHHVNLEVHNGGRKPFTLEAISQYLRANPCLLTLSIRGFEFNGRTDFPRDALGPIRADNRFNDTETLLNHLQETTDLQILVLSRIHFPSGDIVPRILDTIQKLPRLHTIYLAPLPLSDAEQDALVYPTLASLCDLSRNFRNLQIVRLKVDLHDLDLPVHVRSQSSDSRISILQLFPSPRGLPPYTMVETVRVAKYLYDICQRLTSLSDGWKEDSPVKKFWDDIFVIVSSFRTVRDEERRSTPR
ncbi:hypothetical protein NMY22_g6277 [Coprinellus aureogranulatus]|nr:hypothetical protein NMY22_g6277 [Coprinellus aureogranulatus]